MHSFSPNCTLPPVGVRYVSGPNVRGTFEILWTCLATLFLCSWSVLHLNVPAHKERTQRQVNGIKSSIMRSLPKVKWMILTLAVPEYLATMALLDLLSARYSYRSMKRRANEDHVEWEEVHGYYANMGGFAIRFPKLEDRTAEMSTTEARKDEKVNDVDQGCRVDIQIFDANTQMNFSSLHQRKDTKQIIDVDEVRSAQSFTGSPVKDEYARVFAEPKVASGGEITDLSSVNSGSHTNDTANLHASHLPTKANTVLQDTMNSENRQHSSSSGKCISKLNEDVVKDIIEKLEETAGNGVVRIAKKNLSLARLMKSSMKTVFDLFSFDPSQDPFKAIKDIAANLFAFLSANFETLAANSDFICFETQVRTLRRWQHEIWIPDAEQLRLIREWGILNVLPDVSADEIHDRSKSDPIVKGLAGIQVMGFVIQLSRRWHGNLPSSPLEVTVLAYAVLTFGIYLLYWNKPQNVQTRVFLHAVRHPSVDEVIKLAAASSPGGCDGNCYETDDHDCAFQIHNASSHRIAKNDTNFQCNNVSFLFGVGMGGTIFGLLHCIAWNFGSFHSYLDKFLWRIASVITSVAPPMFCLGLCLPGKRFTRVTLLPVMIGLYILSRLFIFVEAFRAIVYLPPDAFKIAPLSWPQIS